MKVLIADDSLIMRQKIQEVIKNLQGIEMQFVGLARNGVEALALAQRTAPELITMDITMPEMTGIEAIQLIRKVNVKAKILVISALSHQDTGLAALKAGANGFLLKPFSEQKLQQAIAKLLGISHA